MHVDGGGNISVVVKVPLLVCRWLNASSRKAQPVVMADATQHNDDATTTLAGPTRSLQAQQGASGVDEHSAYQMLLIPLQHVVLAVVAALACIALLTMSVRQYQINRSISLTSAVHHNMCHNQALGRAPTGKESLLQALMDDPSLIDQLSPTKRATLGLLPVSPFEGGVSFSRGASTSSSVSARDSTSSGLHITPAHSSVAGCSPAHTGSGPLLYEPLRVRLARHSASGGSMPAPYRPSSVPADALVSRSSAPPAPAMMRSAPVSPVGTPVERMTAAGFNGELGSPLLPHLSLGSSLEHGVAAAGPDRLHVLVGGGRTPPIANRMSDSLLPLPATASSPESFVAACSPVAGLRRCSHSFSFGSAEAAPGGASQGWEVFGLSAQPHGTPAADAAGPPPTQLRSKSMVEHSVVHMVQEEQQQEQAAQLLAHWRPLSPVSLQGRSSVDAVRREQDQQGSCHGRVSAP